MKILFTLLFGLSSLSSALYAADIENGILGYMTDDLGLTLQVPSNGCTKKENFKIHLMESFPLQVRFERLERDPCRAILTYGTKITWTWAELGMTNQEEFTIANELKTLRAN